MVSCLWFAMNGHKLENRKFYLNVRKHVFSMRVIEQCNSSPEVLWSLDLRWYFLGSSTFCLVYFRYSMHGLCNVNIKFTYLKMVDVTWDF